MRSDRHGGMKKNPRLCRVNDLFEPVEKVGAYYCRFRLSAARFRRTSTDMHTADKERLPVPRCWLKKRMLITHIAGDS